HLQPLFHLLRSQLAFVLNDQALAGTLQRFRDSDDVRANASYFLGGGSMLWIVWQFATLAGVLAGQLIPASWHLEFVVPLCFIAILVPMLHDRISVLAFVVSAVAVIALDAMPLRLSMICAGLLGITAGVVGERKIRTK